MIKNLVFIHGIAGIKDGSYFTPLRQECEKLNLNVIAPNFGSFREKQLDYNEWADYFKQSVDDWSSTIVVAQSLGTQFAIKFIAENKITPALYVSCAGAFDFNEMREEITNKEVMSEAAKDFLPAAQNYEYFKDSSFPKYSLFTDNDTFFFQENLEKYSSAIGSVPMLIPGKAHFNVPAGVRRLPELEELIKNFIGGKI